MKKLVLIICLILLTTGVFAQKSIEDLNGYDWLSMTTENKLSVIRGYYIACTMISYMSYEIAVTNKATQDQLMTLGKQLDDQFTYSDNTMSMAQKLDNYYASPSNRSFVLYRTIPFVVGKEWWNRNTGKIEGSSSYNGGS